MSVNVNGTKKISSPADQPPLVFPEDNTKYKIIPNNSSIIKTLTHSNKNSTNDSEIYDLLHAPLSDNNDRPFDQRGSSSDHLSVLKLDKNLKSENEQLQPVGAFVEKDSEKQSELPSHTGVWTVVTLTIILAMAGLAYAANLLWPKIQTYVFINRYFHLNYHFFTD